MWTEIFFRYEPAGLSEDCAARSRVQFMVCRDREGLGCAVSKSPSWIVKPKRPRIATISAPERRRSLGMRGRELHRYDNGGVGGKPQGGQVLISQMESDGFLKVSSDLVQREALSNYRDLEAFRHVSRLFSWTNHSHDCVLEHLSPPLCRPV